MTDRVRILTVALDREVRVDDLEAILTAIRMIQGVEAVIPGKPDNPQDWSARMAVRSELQAKLYGVLDEAFHPKS